MDAEVKNEPVVEKKSLPERFLLNVYWPAMRMQVGPVKPLPVFVLLALLGTAVQGAYFASELTPPTKEEVWYPDNHMTTGINDFSLNSFYSSDVDRFTVMTFFWGVKDLDTDGVDPYAPLDFRGTVIYDDAFDLATLEAQKAVLDVCANMQTLACNLDGCQMAR
jgi:hypothetical protein